MLKSLLVLSLLGLAFAAPGIKIDPVLYKSLQTKPLVNIFVKFGNGNQEVLQSLSTLRFNTRGEKATHMVSALKKISEESQRSAVTLLQSQRFAYSAVSFEQFWISNELYVKGANREIINQLMTLSEVSEIREERILSIEDFGDVRPLEEQWNLERIEAPQAWRLPGGNNGAGTVIASIDTGVRHTHEALRNNYRADHGWYDPYSKSAEPNDGNGHGTHTTGTAVGAIVGVAPGAQWIACKGCNTASCTESALIACGQFVACPTNADGTGADCSKVPNIVTNSWGGGGGNDFYNAVIDAWHAVNIIPVFAGGNSGPSCSTIGSPGDNVNVIAVCSTNDRDEAAPGSSLGPARNGAIKPNICAPGVNIRSAWSTSDTAYQQISGTSMATPHVAGAAALLLSRNPNLTYNQVKDLLEKNADTDLVNTGRTCGGIPPDVFPNNQYGHGRVNCRKSLEAAIGNF